MSAAGDPRIGADDVGTRVALESERHGAGEIAPHLPGNAMPNFRRPVVRIPPQRTTGRLFFPSD